MEFWDEKRLAHRILFNQLTVADHGNAITDPFDNIHFVGNQQNRQAQTTVDIFQQFQNRTRGSRIQSAGGFVAEQDFGLLASARAMATLF